MAAGTESFEFNLCFQALLITGKVFSKAVGVSNMFRAALRSLTDVTKSIATPQHAAAMSDLPNTDAQD